MTMTELMYRKMHKSGLCNHCLDMHFSYTGQFLFHILSFFLSVPQEWLQFNGLLDVRYTLFPEFTQGSSTPASMMATIALFTDGEDIPIAISNQLALVTILKVQSRFSIYPQQ